MAPVSPAALPSKLFFRIGEVASLVGVEPHVLRYWEREFRSIRPTKSAKGQRVYSRKDVENLLRVRDLLYRDGFTIAGAKKRLQRGAVELEAASEVLGEPEAEDDDEEVASAEPESGPRAAPPMPVVAGPRKKLTALRAEVEAFLDELEEDPTEPDRA